MSVRAQSAPIYPRMRVNGAVFGFFGSADGADEGLLRRVAIVGVRGAVALVAVHISLQAKLQWHKFECVLAEWRHRSTRELHVSCTYVAPEVQKDM